MAWVNKKPKLAIVVFGFIAGIIGGLTNVMALVLIIYSLESKHSRKEVIQSSNLCFLFGKNSSDYNFCYSWLFYSRVINNFF